MNFDKGVSKQGENSSLANTANSPTPRKRENIRYYLLLHLLLLLYSVGGICSKSAAGYDFLSLGFILWYSGLFVILATYAFFWQKVLKHLQLTTAYANKGVTVIWGFLWGMLLFGEQITWNMILGAMLIMVGVVVVVKND